MASIRKVGKRYYVIYYYVNEKGVKKQKWESVTNKAEANRRKSEVELSQFNNSFISPTTKTVATFLREWVDVYGKANWEYGTYTTNVALLENHVIPYIGETPIQQLVPLEIEKLYQLLRNKKVAGAKSHCDLCDIPCLSSTTVRLIHSLLKRAFKSAVQWKLISENPVTCKAPKKNQTEAKIWDAQTVARALQAIDHEMLHLAVHISFICSLRIGEAMGLTWNCVDLERGCITINKTCQRVSKKALAELPKDSLVCTFPSSDSSKKSVIVLKKPKTPTSIRTVYLTKPLIHELRMRHQLVIKEQCFHNHDYNNYDLVFCSDVGLPIEPKLCEKWFKKWLSRTDGEFPDIIFHEIRHSSTTYKLSISDGDFKSVQADNGHATADMTINTYDHFQDSSRHKLIEKLEKYFYPVKVIDQTNEINTTPKISESDVVEMIKKNPELLSQCLHALEAKKA